MRLIWRLCTQSLNGIPCKTHASIPALSSAKKEAVRVPNIKAMVDTSEAVKCELEAQNSL